MRALVLGVGTGLLVTAASAQAIQVLPDRADPALVTRSLPVPRSEPVTAPTPVRTATPPAARVALVGTIRPARIVVDGAEHLPPGMLDRVTAPYAGRALSPEDLRDLAGAVAAVARASGLVLATASIQPQPLDSGALVITLDEGRIDAVRSLGTPNQQADRVLSRLVTHRGMTKRELETTLMLVGDLPGITVVNTRYARENGFGILLVTLATDRVSLFAQGDNRGTDEIGPWRTTELASLRGVASAGDELGILASQTPHDPREFEFVSGRYAWPIGRAGAVLDASAFYGTTHAGGYLRALDLTGRTYGGGIGTSVVLERSRQASLWLDVDLKALENVQRLRGRRFRDDTLSILSGTLRTQDRIAGGSFRGGLTVSWGLPIGDTTRDGDPFASRADGSARFVTASFEGDWRRPIAGPLSIELAAAGQAASRPLLATAEISLGGPLFGRAYDYSERTGDEGVLGSAELQLNLGDHAGSPLPRLQLYAFADGGTVHNLQRGIGGGSLASAGGGVRLGRGQFDGGLEVGLPINADRVDTSNKSPRVSLRLSMFL
ncbi:ShlB/FhaC/HecB family hemolysin secretion/activation protein [Sphingomonas sp.]|uniref:ShlB/FhaC/HecB family hemolysin secretion/activation protein n=1 Tax=Sphingomonas sp. TaxID=28214 RepID=UPI003B0070FE